MTWHISTAPRDDLDRVLADIRHHGGTVTRCMRDSNGVRLICWYTR